MNYQAAAKAIDRLRADKGEVLFRMAVSHLIDVGLRHLTLENVASTYREIEKEDDSHSFMTNDFKKEIVRAAYELAQFDHIHLLVYIQRNVSYDVGDGAFLSEWPDTMQNLLDSFYYDTECSTIYDELQRAGFTDGDIELMHYGYVIPEEQDDPEDAE